MSRAKLFLCCLTWVLLILPVCGQTNEELFSDLQFNFAPPGAKSAAMGRAFIGQADDASTAATNPAGLVNLKDVQIYAEFKHTDLTFQRFQVPETHSDLNSLSFLTVTAPLGSRAVVAFTRHEFLKHRENLMLPQRFLDPERRFYIIPLQGRGSFDGDSYSGSIAVELPGKLNLGVTGSASRMHSDTRLFSSLDDFEHLIRGTDWAPAGSVGLLYWPVERFSVGAVYSRGPKFNLPQQMTRAVGSVPLTFNRSLPMHIPDRIGLGMSVKPGRDFSVLFDAVRVRYSQLASPTQLILAGTGVNSSDFYMKDGTEYHVGTEYGIPMGHSALYLRAGFLTDPDHSLKFKDTGKKADQGSLLGFSAVFNPNSPGTNYGGTAGIGVNVGESWQMDAAFVRMERLGELSGSIAYTFR